MLHFLASLNSSLQKLTRLLACVNNSFVAIAGKNILLMISFLLGRMLGQILQNRERCELAKALRDSLQFRSKSTLISALTKTSQTDKKKTLWQNKNTNVLESVK